MTASILMQHRMLKIVFLIQGSGWGKAKGVLALNITSTAVIIACNGPYFTRAAG